MIDLTLTQPEGELLLEALEYHSNHSKVNRAKLILAGRVMAKLEEAGAHLPEQLDLFKARPSVSGEGVVVSVSERGPLVIEADSFEQPDPPQSQPPGQETAKERVARKRAARLVADQQSGLEVGSTDDAIEKAEASAEVASDN